MVAERPTRRDRRFNVSFPLWVRIRQRRRGKTLSEGKSELDEETITSNISTSGCFFYLSRKPPVGSPAILEINVPARPYGLHTGKILCHGKVVRVSDQKVGGKVGVACTIDSYAFNSAKLG